mmetsp:Transcript_17863/g.30217  ORF Transcript_17863/g.30217 Transcript_17863/m.30217 type:complete len:114 (+) Transcript_17863:935-1276(+)
MQFNGEEHEVCDTIQRSSDKVWITAEISKQSRSFDRSCASAQNVHEQNYHYITQKVEISWITLVDCFVKYSFAQTNHKGRKLLMQACTSFSLASSNSASLLCTVSTYKKPSWI